VEALSYKTGTTREAGSIFFNILLLLVLLLAAGYAVFYLLFGYTIAPGYMGVRQIKLGPWQGFSQKGLPPGTHWGLPGYTVMHYVPQTIRAIDFSREGASGEGGVHKASPAYSGQMGFQGFPGQEQAARPGDQGIVFVASAGAAKGAALEIQTSDRASVNVDLTVLSRFYTSPGEEDGLKHNGPAELIKSIGASPERWENHIRYTAEDVLKRTLGTISSDEFYNPHKREKQLAQALRMLNQSLAPAGIKVEALLLRRYTYKDERIDQAIFQKNIQKQEERLNIAASKLAEAHAALEQVAAEWDAKIRTLQVEGENKARVLKSEGDLYENRKKAEGDLAIAKAKAEVDALRAKALASGAGAETYVARELSSLLSSIQGGIVSDINPYDLGEWAVRLGVKEAKEEKP